MKKRKIENIRKHNDEGTRIIFRGRCPDCGKRTYIIEHHFVTKRLVKYLVEVCGFNKGDIKALRNQLTVRICVGCEKKFHDGEFYNESRRSK